MRAIHGLEESNPGQGRIFFALWQGDGISMRALAERTALEKQGWGPDALRQAQGGGAGRHAP